MCGWTQTQPANSESETVTSDTTPTSSSQPFVVYVWTELNGPTVTVPLKFASAMSSESGQSVSTMCMLPLTSTSWNPSWAAAGLAWPSTMSPAVATPDTAAYSTRLGRRTGIVSRCRMTILPCGGGPAVTPAGGGNLAWTVGAGES